MKDCRVAISVKDDKVSLEGENISMVELTELCGALQIIAGVRARALGLDMDEVKSNMLDVHLAAMRIVEEQEVV